MPSAKEIIKLGQIEIRFLLDSEETAGRLTMFEFLVAPDARVPAPHYHEQFDETLYGLDGVLTFVVGDKTIALGPGDYCFVPRGVVHHFINRGSVATRTLSVITPGLLGPSYFRDLAAVLVTGAPDPAQVAAIMRQHGLIVVPAST